MSLLLALAGGAGPTNYTITANAGAYSVTGSAATITRTGGQPTYTAEVELRRWYVKRGKKIHLFASAQDADAWMVSESVAQAVIQEAQKTSRRARKRLRERVFTPEALPVQTIDTDWLARLIERFAVPVDLPSLLAQQDWEKVMQIQAMVLEMQEDDDIELLLLV